MPPPLAGCLLLVAAASAVAAAAPQQATCKINIEGFDNDAEIGVASADVACTTSNGKPLVIGVSSAYMPGWSEQFSPNWVGVTIEPDLPCNLKPDSNPVAENKVDGGPMHALLYFCGDYELTLDQPRVQGLQLQSNAFGLQTGSTDSTSSDSSLGLGSAGDTANPSSDQTSGSSGSAYIDAVLHSVMSSSDAAPQINAAINSPNLKLDPDAAVILIGGGVRATVTSGTFVGNKHLGFMLRVDGRGLVGNTSVVVDNCTFENIVAERQSAILATHRGQVQVQGCMFHNHTVITHGGAVGAKGPYTLVQVRNSNFKNYMAGLNGGAVYAGFAGVVDITNSLLFNNKAYQMGGAAHADFGGVINLDNKTRVLRNVAGLGGAFGCFYANISVSNGVILSDNFAFAGGGIFLADCGANITDSSVINNACDISGGAGIDFRGSCHLQLVNSNVSNNKALKTFDTAGGLYGSLKPPQTSDPASFEMWKHPIIVTLDESGNSGSIVLYNSVISGNQGDTGGFLVPENYTVSLVNTTVHANTGNTTGGVSSYGDLSIIGGIVSNNYGMYGGAVAAVKGFMACIGCIMASNHALLDGGAVFAGTDSITPIISGSVIINNSARRNGGGLLLQDDAHSSIKDSLISDNSATGNNSVGVALGGGVMLSGNAVLNINNSQIDSNSALSGGGIYAGESAAVLVTGASEITNNTALTGGGVAFNGGNLSIVSPSIVTNNLAQIQAGGVMLQSDAFNAGQLSHAVYNNSAPFHVNVGVTPTNLSISSRSPNRGGVVTLLSDSGVVPLLVNVTGIHGVPCDGEAIAASIQRLPSGQRFTVVNISQVDGGAWLELPLSPGAYAIEVSHKFNRSVPTAQVNLQLQSCNRGQILSAQTGLCQLCPSGSFSYVPSSSSCAECPAGAECPGGAMLLVQPGFWRSTNLSDQIHRCANPSACGQTATSVNNKSTCQIDGVNGNSLPCTATGPSTNGSQTSADLMDLQCSPGYEGNLCGVCAAGYGTHKPFGCRKCFEQKALVASLVIAAILLLLMIKGLCHFTVKGAVQSQQGMLVTQATGCGVQLNLAQGSRSPQGQGTTAPGHKLQPTDLLKTLVLYFQYLLIIASLNIEWPVSILYPFQALAWLFSSASPETLSMDCLFSRDDALPLAIKKTLFYLTMPLLMLCVLLLLEAAAHCFSAGMCGKQRRRVNSEVRGSLFDRLLSCAVVVLFFFLPSLARTTFSLFACVQLDNPAAGNAQGSVDAYAAIGRFWMLDMNQLCYHGYHKAWSLALGMPLLFLLCFALPAMVLGLTLHSRRRTQKNSAYICHYSFLSEPYKPAMCYWEGVLALQTQGLVAISVFGFTLGSYYQTIVLHTAIASILLLLIVLKPHAKTAAGVVMQRGIFCLLVTTLVALTFMPNGYVEPSPKYGLAMGVILVLFNMLFIVSVVAQLIATLDWAGIWMKVVSVVSAIRRMCVRFAGKVTEWLGTRRASSNVDANKKEFVVDGKDSTVQSQLVDEQHC